MAKIRFQDVVNKMDHTKTPWFNAVFDHADRIGIFRDTTRPGDAWKSADPIAYIEMIEGNTNQPIPEAMANADFIVKAANSHEALLEAAKIGLSYMRPGHHDIVYGTDLKTVKSAIAQAESI